MNNTDTRSCLLRLTKCFETLDYINKDALTDVELIRMIHKETNKALAQLSAARNRVMDLYNEIDTLKGQ